MPVSQLVSRDRKFGDVRLENGIAGHLPENALVAFAALFPRNDFGTAKIGNVVRLPPSLLYLLGRRVEIRFAFEPLGKLGLRSLDEAEASEDLDHEGKGRDCENAGRMRGVVVEVPMNRVERHREEAAFAPRDFRRILRVAERGVTASF